MSERTTLIDFVETYSRKYPDHVYLREKVDGVWKEITQEQTRETAYRIGAGMMSLGAKKGDKVSLLSESRAMWILSELGALYAGMTDVPLSVNLGAGEDLIFRINHSDSRYIFVSGNHLPKIREIVSRCPTVEKVIVYDDTAFDYESLEPGEIRMSDIIRMGEEFLTAHRDEFVARFKSVT
ncbi:MAG: AMP-binding protein, partial [Bacteroidales bacterium]|nr:AMP-binding protein [Bacteroidales bacterium]